jgi:magnesium-transporting ATPase (P-type)
LNDISPSHHTLGLISAVSLVLTSAVRAFSPTFFTTVFAFGVSEQILRGYFIWLVLLGFALILTIAAFYLPKRAEGIIKHDDARMK